MQTTLFSSHARLTMRTALVTWAPSVVTAGLMWAATAAGRIPIPGTPVPITLQTLVVMMAGLLLTWRQAAAAVVLYLTMGACGLPVFSGGASTMALFGPSAGFLFGFLPAIVTTALLAQLVRRFTAQSHNQHEDSTDQHHGSAAAMRWALRFTLFFAAAIVGCIALHYTCGLLIQSMITHVPISTIAVASLGFLPGDFIKAALAAAIAAIPSGNKKNSAH